MRLSPFLLLRDAYSLPCRRTPQHPYDVHVLRTYTRELNAWIVRLQLTYPHASDTINHVIYALNNTFHEVELSYMVWRNDRVQTILQHGAFSLSLFLFLSLILRTGVPHVQDSSMPEIAFKLPSGAASEANLLLCSQLSTPPSTSREFKFSTLPQSANKGPYLPPKWRGRATNPILMGPLLPLLQAPGVPLIPLSPLSRKLLSSMRSKIHTPVVTIMQPHPNRATSRRLHRRVVPGA